jgi:uncharacterized repeat protein (TIGR01451 family)
LTQATVRPLRQKEILMRALPAIVILVSLVSSHGVPAGAEPPATPPWAGGGLPPTVATAVQHDTSPALQDMPALPPTAGPKFRLRRLARLGPSGIPHGSLDADAVVQDVPGIFTVPSTSQNFEGISSNGQSGLVGVVLPPDPNADVGPNHVVQWVNVTLAIYDKSGNPLYGPAAGSTLWQGFGGACETSNDGDPIVLYDHLADRWFMSQLAIPNFPNGPFYQCIAVSQTPDPLGAYHRYAFVVSNTKLNDYPKFGVWPDGYYLAVNQFTCRDLIPPFGFIVCDWGGQGAAAFERSRMLLGQPAQMVFFELPLGNLGGMLPADLDGPPPPAGAPNPFVQVDDGVWFNPTVPDRLQIWPFHVDWVTPSNSTFGPNPPGSSLGIVLETAPFDSNMCGYQPNCIPQPGFDILGLPSPGLDAISDRLMYRLQYRNFGTHETLVVNHTVDVNGADLAGIRWYELRNAGAGWGIHQQGTYAPNDGLHRWMGSAAMDSAGNIALGFSVSSRTTSPGIRYVGREAGDPPGTMGQEATIAGVPNGAGYQLHSAGRWGDYSSLSVDPTDDCTFWYTQEYYASADIFFGANWQTRIASFKFPSCGAAGSGADLAVTKTDSPDPVLVGSPLTYTVTVSNAGPDAATLVGLTDTLPAGVTFGSATPSQGTCAEAGGVVTCDLGTLASAAGATVTIVVTPATTGVLTNTATAAAAEADGNPANNTATATTTVNPAVSVTVLAPNGGEVWRIGRRATIQWTSSGIAGGINVELSRDGGATWSPIITNTRNDGSQRWNVTGPATTQARVRVCSAANPGVCDQSDGGFTIQ